MATTVKSPEHEPPEREPRDQYGEEELVAFLERDQLVADTSIPVPRAHLSARAQRWMWALRIFTLSLSGMVVYTFSQQL